MPIDNDTTPVDRKPENPAEWLKPGEPYIVEGLDWSWAYVVFRPVTGYPAYCVSSEGHVWTQWSLGQGRKKLSGKWRRLYPSLNKGYARVRLCSADKAYKFESVHRLVLQEFIGPCPEGKECCHGPDPTRNNNRLRNLRWGTDSENTSEAWAYRAEHGLPQPNNTKRREESHFAKLTAAQVVEMRELALSGATNREIAKRFDLHIVYVSYVMSGNNWGEVDPESRDAVKAYRKARRTVLSPEDIPEIRRLHESGLSHTKIAERFGVSRRNISMIIRGERWSSTHVVAS